MKLSEVLKKDWPERLDEGLSDQMASYYEQAYNTALTSCDREIDREALAKIISGAPFPSTRSLNKADHIISNMPTWLKPTERDKK